MKVLSIGSSDIDLFVTPQSDTSYVSSENTVSFSLGDKVPIDMNALTLGGNAANVSVGLKRLGLDTSFYTFLGEDMLSRYIVETLEKEQIEVVEGDTKLQNASLSLIFNFKTDRIIFSHHEVQQYAIDASKLDSFQAFYLTSIGKEWVSAYKTVVDFVHSHAISLAFSPGSHQLLDINDVVLEAIACSKILFVNKEEGEKILEKKGETAADMKELLVKLSNLGPLMVSVTDGKNGSYAVSENVCYVLPSFDREAQGVDKTGAGDSYASAFFAALLLEKDIKTAMKWGAVNANSVMTQIGAQKGLLSQSDIELVLQNRPDFTVEML